MFKLCYDFARRIELDSFNGESYESIREELRNEHADDFRFFDKKDGGFPWWIIVLIVVLLILIAALVSFILKTMSKLVLRF